MKPSEINFGRLGAIAAVGLSVVLVAPRAMASSHREAPLISQDPTVDATDLYAWRDATNPNMVNIVANYDPFEDPAGGPNFDRFSKDALYAINIDNNGDSLPDLSFQFKFKDVIENPNTFLYNTGPISSLTDPNFNYRQYYDVSVLRGGPATRGDSVGTGTVIGSNLPCPPDNIGPKSIPNYESIAESAVSTLGATGIRVYAGQRDDPFFVDVASIFDLLTLRPLPSPVGSSTPGLDSPTSGMNVRSIIIQVPISYLTANNTIPTSMSDPNAIIGITTFAYRPRITIINTDGTKTTSGPYRQVSRLGMPLVNEVVVPLGKKDLFNSSQPNGDAQFLPRVTNPELPALLNALYGVNVPPAPRNDLVQVFLTGVPGLNQPANVVPSEQLRLNMAVAPSPNPDRLGVLAGDLAGFPNGRRLTDDVVDIELRVSAGVLVSGYDVAPNNLLEDGVDANDHPFLDHFPYVAVSNQGYSHEHDHGTTEQVTPAILQPVRSATSIRSAR